jgi:hypothetical protein
VRATLAEPCQPFRKSLRSQHDTDAFDTLGFHVYYGGALPEVEYIDLFHVDQSAFLYEDVDIFRTRADDLFQFLASHAKWYERVGSYIFPTLQFGVWRSHPFDPNYDKFDRWEAFGVARPGYFSDTPPQKARHSKQRPPPPCPFAS